MIKQIIFSKYKKYWILLILIAMPFIVNLPVLLGIFKSNPLLMYSGLGKDIKNLVPGLSSVDPNIAFTSQTLGHLSAVDWIQGIIPWWNPYEGVGVPLAGEMQSAALFPLTILLYFSNGQLYFHIVLEIIAGICTYQFLKRLVSSDWIAMVGGILFELNGSFSWFGHATFNPIAFLPVVLWGVDKVFFDLGKKNPMGWIIISIGLSLSIYSGFPEVTYIYGLFIIAWFLFRVYELKGKTLKFTYIKRVLLGGIVGLLISAPILIPFIEYLAEAHIGAHDSGFGNAHLSLTALAMLVLPYFHGPITTYSSYDETNSLSMIWGNIGGYLSVALFILTFLGLIGKKNRRLRGLLFVTFVLVLCKTYGLFGIGSLLNYLPGMSDVAFYRYSFPLMAFICVVLASMALDDVNERENTYFKQFYLVSIVIIVALILLTLSLSIKLSHAPNYILYPLISILYCSILMIMIQFLLQLSNKNKTFLLAVVLILESCVLFIIPMSSNPIKGSLNVDGISYLQKNLGYSRFYTLGPISPNYGSYFGISSINHNDLPISSRWVNYLENNLDTNSDPVAFNGNARKDPKGASSEQELRRNLKNFEWVGVKYVVTANNSNPFEDKYSFGNNGGSENKALAVSNTKNVSGELSNIPEGEINEFKIFIGNYNNHANGKLKLKIMSSEGDSAEGEVNLNQTKDNSYCTITLDHSVSITKGTKLAFTISQVNGDNPFAVWVWPLNDKKDQLLNYNNTPVSDYGAMINLIYQPTSIADKPKLVFKDDSMNIYELPHTSPYFSADESSDANFNIESRTKLTVNSNKPFELIRRELYYPGWVVYMDGKKMDISEYEGLFQSLNVPAGQHTIEFSYLPRFMKLGGISLLIGFIMIFINLFIYSIKRKS